MIHLNTINKICYHAGIYESLDFKVSPIVDLLWKRQDLNEAVKDILNIFQMLNIELNSEVPSEDCVGEEHIPRRLVYAVGEILLITRLAAEKAATNDLRYEVMRAARQIEIGWLAVMAGDIDDIVEHIILEERAREASDV